MLNSSAANLSPWYHRFNLLNVLLAFVKRCRGVQLHPIESTIVRLTSYRHRRDTRLIEHWSEYRKKISPAFPNAYRQLYAAFRYQCPASLLIPVSILCGDRDALVNMQSSKALAQHFKVELMVLAYCGHDITIDAPAKLVHYLFDIISLNQDKADLQLVDCADLLDEEIAYHEAKLIQAIPRYSSALPAESE